MHYALGVPDATIDVDQSPSSQEWIHPHFGEQVGNSLRRSTPLPHAHAPADCQTSVQFLRLIHRMPSQHGAAVLERSPHGPRIRVRFVQALRVSSVTVLQAFCAAQYMAAARRSRRAIRHG